MNWRSDETETFYITCTLLYQTDAAIKVNDGDIDVWLPKSQIMNPEPHEWPDIPVGDTVEIELPLWLAKEKELVE